MKSPADLGRSLCGKGDHDLETAEQLLAFGRPLDTACFHLQQAVEKYLKAFLALQGIEYPPTHNLHVLFDLCRSITDGLEPLRRRFDSFGPYAIEMRYDDALEPDIGEIRAGLESVLALRANINSLVPEGTFAPLERRAQSGPAGIFGFLWSLLSRNFSPRERK